jgi:hypothetical protein
VKPEQAVAGVAESRDGLGSVWVDDDMMDVREIDAGSIGDPCLPFADAAVIFSVTLCAGAFESSGSTVSNIVFNKVGW